MKYHHNKKQTNWPVILLGWVILLTVSVLLGLFLGFKYVESHLPQVQARGAFLELQEKPQIKLHANNLTEDWDIQDAAGSWVLYKTEDLKTADPQVPGLNIGRTPNLDYEWSLR